MISASHELFLIAGVKKKIRFFSAYAKKHLSKEEAILIKKNLDKYDFQNEHHYFLYIFLFAYSC
ncbi:hypothetical protein [Borreliella bavariensis]|uniref:hypothetical protein n=1 Tax=Borreliella bavariensis TaxID=664662 RepID=UPI001CF2BF4D|nr:hypothetical protein [Borreliella bavariensis]WLN24725.1 hypothetical protein IDK87_05735 [Borreliella bavariensis]